MATHARRMIVKIGASLVLPVLILAFFQLAAGSPQAPSYVVAPSSVAHTIWSMAVSGKLTVHVVSSLYRAYAGFVIGAVLGIALGLLSGASKRIGGFFDPLVSLTYPVPKIALLPIMMSWLGFGDASKIAIIALGVFFPVFINSLYGARAVAQRHVWSAQNMGASRSTIFFKVIMPTAAPQIFSGLRTGLALSFIVLFAAEMVGSRSGLGFLVLRAEDSQQFDLMYAAVFLIGVIGFVSDRVLLMLRRPFLAGRPT